ncbi:MAG: uracil-DNA glycosylase family protein [Candidatus Pacearchaeota archaeon]|nr:MAG: uracil-DNA glycosylase family protein [Candidatus Pacearchaeota archaeon]
MANNFSELVREIKACRDCRSLFGFEPNPVFGGNQNAKILQISQAPSNTAHATGKLWADKGGEKLKYKWYQISDKQFYNPKNFYITALAHCYPGKTKSGDKNPPIICAKKWLVKELEVLNPQLFIVIGGLAAKFLFPDQNFTNLIFNNQILKGELCLVLPHPSPQNIKWFKDHPDFESKRLPKIRKIIHDVLYRQK